MPKMWSIKQKNQACQLLDFVYLLAKKGVNIPEHATVIGELLGMEAKVVQIIESRIKQEQAAQSQHQYKNFDERLARYGKWGEKIDMDRFLILVFMTVEEKRKSSKQLGVNPQADYIDGRDFVQKITNTS